MSSLAPSPGRIVLVVDTVMGHLIDDREALLSCRLVNTLFHESSSRIVFRNTSILTTMQARTFLDANRGGFLLGYVRELQLGYWRTRSHDHQAQPLEIDTKQLAEICNILHSLKRIKFGKIVLKSPYKLYSTSPVPGGFPPGQLILLRDAPGPHHEGPPAPPTQRPYHFDGSDPEVEEVNILVPSRETLAVGDSGEHGIRSLEGGRICYSQRLPIHEVTLHNFEEAVLAEFWHSMAFYGTTPGTWQAFGRLLARCGEGIKSLALSSTNLRMLHSCDKISRFLVPAIAQCTSLESLTVSLLLGAGSVSAIEDQWRANLALLRATHRATLCTVRLVIDMNAADESPTHLMQLKDLDWTKITELLRADQYPVLKTVQYHIISSKGLDTRADVEQVVHAGLYPLRRDNIIVSSPPYAPHATFYD